MIDIEKLKNIDFSKIDLKNIDINKILPVVMEKKDLLAQVVVIVVSFFILCSIGGNYHTQTQDQQAELVKLKEKSDVIAEYESELKRSKAFVGKLPKELDVDLFSSQITDYAVDNNITVMSFSPGQMKSDKLSETMSAVMNVRAANYSDFLQFIKAVEESPYGLRIDGCSISVATAIKQEVLKKGEKASPPKEGMIEAQINISSVTLKK